jgi:hypothetical protein
VAPRPGGTLAYLHVLGFCDVFLLPFLLCLCFLSPAVLPCTVYTEAALDCNHTASQLQSLRLHVQRQHGSAVRQAC